MTFTNARRPKEVAASVPLDRLVLKQIAPISLPTPTGARPITGYLPLIAAEIARLRGVTLIN